MDNWDSQSILTKSPFELFKDMDRDLGGDWVSWEVETILSHAPDHIDQMAVDKILAVHLTARNIELTATVADVIEKITNAFCNQPCLMDAIQPPHIEELMYAVDQIERIGTDVHGEKDMEEFKFGGQVPGYVAAAAKYHDWTVLPKPLSFAQSILDFLTGMKWRRAKDKKIDTAIAALLDLSEKIDGVDDISMENASIKQMLDDFDNGRSEYKDAARIVGCYLFKPA